ncbi:MAG: glucose dehydrogenase, partial [Actinobacteria bacterium]|nr:glucose dehydrogenase [Actinomycetota bacterium]
MFKVISLLLLLTLVAQSSSASEIKVGDLALDVASFDVEITKSLGGNDRGPALAVLKDGTVLLGGGVRGGSIFAWREEGNELVRLGEMISAKERIKDSRFAITDIAVLSETQNSANLLISFPRLTSARCVEVVVFRATFDRVNSTINNKGSAYLTVGDLGYGDLGDRNLRGDLGSVFRITAKGAKKISSGHRNQQGIALLDDKTLLVSEHGPRGGDEINIIENGIDYGWPFVTYGAPYSQGDYVIPTKPGTHVGFREPIKQWTPSIAPTELVQLPRGIFGKYGGGLVMGTLREASLVFMRFENGKILETQIS